MNFNEQDILQIKSFKTCMTYTFFCEAQKKILKNSFCQCNESKWGQHGMPLTFIV